MAVVTCENCGARNRVDERATAAGKRPVCGACGRRLVAGAAAAGGGRPVAVTDATFGRDVLEASRARPVLLDCWAAWCGPCRMIAPVMDELAAEAGGRYTVAKLDVDENPQTAAQFGVRSIPTLFIFKDGQLVDRLMGAQPKSVIAARLAAHS
ncbi:MAG TPA: thioredoxin [Pyrinomonadaceae bacterium]|nr:thioredoxin [Pyrinomonadaceae bacterium]